MIKNLKFYTFSVTDHNPFFIAGGNEFPVNMHQKEQLRDNAVSMMQSQQHLPVGPTVNSLHCTKFLIKTAN